MFMKRKLGELVALIKDAIRRKAQEIPGLKESRKGAICISFYPLNKKADYWMGGLGDFDGGFKDIPGYNFAFAIAPGADIIETLYSGSISVEVGQNISQNLGHAGWSSLYTEKFCSIRVYVYGGDYSEDKQCALEAVSVIEKFFGSEKKEFVCKCPELSSKNEELG